MNLRSDWLLKGVVIETPIEACKSQYINETITASSTDLLRSRNESIKGLPDGIQPSMICASNRERGMKVDTCQGDSGTGLMIPINKVFYLYGVTSFGLSCNTNLPSFYTRVSTYLQWIENIVWT